MRRNRRKRKPVSWFTLLWSKLLEQELDLFLELDMTRQRQVAERSIPSTVNTVMLYAVYPSNLPGIDRITFTCRVKAVHRDWIRRSHYCAHCKKPQQALKEPMRPAYIRKYAREREQTLWSIANMQICKSDRVTCSYGTGPGILNTGVREGVVGAGERGRGRLDENSGWRYGNHLSEIAAQTHSKKPCTWCMSKGTKIECKSNYKRVRPIVLCLPGRDAGGIRKGSSCGRAWERDLVVGGHKGSSGRA